MTDTVFRTKQVPVKEESKPSKVVDPKAKIDTTSIEVPYTDYKTENGHPYTADHYELGDHWEVYNEELSLIEDYFGRQIESGEWSNDKKTIQTQIKKLERLLNLKDESRTSVKLGVLSAHIKFLNEADGVRKDSRKYGT